MRASFGLSALAICALVLGALTINAGPVVACACCGTWKVTGVAQDDVLNIRAGPGPHYEKVGEIPSGSGCVIKSDECTMNWCRVTYAEQKGWVSTRYLSYIE